MSFFKADKNKTGQMPVKTVELENCITFCFSSVGRLNLPQRSEMTGLGCFARARALTRSNRGQISVNYAGQALTTIQHDLAKSRPRVELTTYMSSVKQSVFGSFRGILGYQRALDRPDSMFSTVLPFPPASPPAVSTWMW